MTTNEVTIVGVVKVFYGNTLYRIARVEERMVEGERVLVIGAWFVGNKEGVWRDAEREFSESYALSCGSKFDSSPTYAELTTQFTMLPPVNRKELKLIGRNLFKLPQPPTENV